MFKLLVILFIIKLFALTNIFNYVKRSSDIFCSLTGFTSHQSLKKKQNIKIIPEITPPILLSSALKNNYQKFTTPILLSSSLKNNYQKSPPTLYTSLFSNTKNNHQNHHPHAYQSFQTLKKHKSNVIIINTHL